MDSKCRDTQDLMLDWFYEEEEDRSWDFDHVQQCRECQAYYQKLLKIEGKLPREPMEFQASDSFVRALEDQVRKERMRVEEKKEKKRYLKELGAFPGVAFLLLTLMGSLFYNGIGPSFIQVQLVGFLIFPLIIPILGVVEKKQKQGRDSYGS